MTDVTFNKDLDVKGLNCPLPILRAKKALTNMESGQVLRVVATDPGSVKDFAAFCKQTGSIYYFGEEVDLFKNGKMTKGEDAWMAEGKNKAGVAMPGLVLLGARYYQEIAPGVAMDRAEIISTNEKINTSSGNFTNCLKTEETTPLKPREKEYKFYARGIGLIQENDLLLTKYGFIK